MHIVVDGSGLARPEAGVGTYSIQMLAAMGAARPLNRFTVYVPAGIPQVPGISAREIPGPRLFGRHLRWPARMRRLRPDAYLGLAGQLPLGSLGMPAVIVAHDLAIYRNRDWFPRRQPLSTHLVVPRSIRGADAILSVSENTARDLAELFAVEPERITVAYPGVADSFRPLSREEIDLSGLRQRLPERFILFVGSVEPRKNLPTLLDAWAMLTRRPPLVIAGGWGWRYEDVRDRIERLGEGVILLGSVPSAQLPALYNLATCLAHPAWYEGFGLTPLEAMACGTPVVCSDRASLPEVVGDAALSADPADVGAWRAQLERLLDDPSLRSELRRRGIARAAEFSWAKTAATAWRVLERAVRRPARG